MKTSEERYDDLLDEIYPPITFGRMSYSPSEVLKAVDPVAYRCGMADFESMENDEEGYQ